MGKLQFTIPHSLTQDDAKVRMERLVQHWADKYGVRQTWNAHTVNVSGKVMGINLEAKLDVLANAVQGEASDPGMLLRGQARKYLEERLKRHLDPSKTLDQLKGSTD
jgi:hypothetical protein